MPPRASSPRARTRYVTTHPFMAYPHGRLVKIGPDQIVHIATPTPDGTAYRWDRVGPADQHPWVTDLGTIPARPAKARPDWPTQ